LAGVAASGETLSMTLLDPAAERLRRQREVALGYRIFASLRWGDLGDGHITARDPERPDHLWMLRHHVPFEHATVNDLVLIGPDGAIVEGTGQINITGYLIHHPIHEARPEIVSAAHAHGQWSTPFSAECRLLEPIVQEACIFYDDHSLFEGEEVQVSTYECGKRIAVALGENRAVILRNHGFLTTGRSVAETIQSFVQMERVAEAHLKAPNAKPISREAALAAKADLLGAGDGDFGYLVARHVGDPSVVG